jgi:GTP-binding protein
MKFIDKSKIFIKAGDGGNGSVAFGKGPAESPGPSGGNGGNGGAIVFLVDPQKSTLIDFAARAHFFAENGANGAKRRQTGKSGDDVVLRVPPGTQIWDEKKERMLFDAVRPGEQYILIKGGKGGAGNACFKSSTNQAPMVAMPGEKIEGIWIWLILKIIADIGLVGLPNAGKSSLLNLLSSANSKVGDYPFTTLAPQLGALKSALRPIIIADVPGIISGAHQNKGLGLEFLGHIERCGMLLYILDITSDCVGTLSILLNEIRHFSPDLLMKKCMIVLNKTDLVDNEVIKNAVTQLKRSQPWKILSKENVIPLELVSCVSRTGIESLCDHLFLLNDEIRTISDKNN